MICSLKTIGNTCSIVVLLLAAILGFTGCSDISKAPAPAPVPSTDATLSSLTISPGTLQPAFLSDVTTYTVAVTTSISSVTLTAEPQIAGATISINGQTITNLSVTLGPAGSNTPISIVVTAPNGSQSTYIVTVNRAAPAGNNSLQSLTVSSGTLAPAFNANTLNYSDDVASSVSSVSVTATLQDTNASMTVNGQATNSGQAYAITLGVTGSSTLVTIIVTAPNLTQKTYTVLVNRAALGGNNNLQSLTVSSGTLAPPFVAGTTSYSVGVASGVGSVTVTAQAQDAGATVSINGQTTTSLSVTLNPAGSSTLISIVVTAPNGTQQTYSVTVNRAALGGNNNLQSLTVTASPPAGALSPAFSASTTSYTVDVASSVNSVTVTATLQDTNASMTVNGQGTSSGQARTITPLNGPGSSTLISIVVTAPNGTQQTYSVTVNQAALGGNNNLQNLTVSPGALSPAFSASTTSYTVDVASSVNSVTVTATLQDTNASMTVNGQGTSSGQARTITPLNGPGLSTLITIVVTAPNGSQKTYFVTVNQAALGGNNNLQNLTVSPGALSPAFSASTTSYTVDVASSVNSVTVTATLQDTNASMTVNGQGTSSGQARTITPLNGPGLSTLITIVVTAPNGSQKTYFVTVNQAALASNAGLSNLAVNTGTLSPVFLAPGVSGLPGYTVAVLNATTSITVTAVTADPNATLTISPSATVNNLPVGNTVFTIEVTAPNGNQKTYFVTVNRAAPLSNNANLFALEVFAGASATPPALALTPPFSSATTSYTTAEVANTVTQVTIVATPADLTATMTIGGVASTGQGTVSIGAPGSTTPILIVVTPPSGSADAITYTVNVPEGL